ncbi:hypothetical protein LCGC14_3109830, partial [marine sediment metagenome]
RCGNSLIGLGQKTEINTFSISFEAISGNKSTGIPPENKKMRSKAREIIKKEIKERKIQGVPILITSFFTNRRTADICSSKFQEIIDLPEIDFDSIKQKENMYNKLRKNEKYQQALDEANIWVSPYFWSFESEVQGEIPRYTTIEQLRNNIQDPELKKLMVSIGKIAEDNQFFHWYIEFPEVFSSERGGFDCILTNPPWETLQLKESEFFKGLNNDILSAPNQSERRKLIKQLQEKDLGLFMKYKNAWKAVKKLTHFLITSGLYLLTAKGTLNTYALFTDRCWRLLSKTGYFGIIIPTGIINNYYLRDFFKELIQKRAILNLFDFINNKQLFNIHRDYRFCLLSI